MQKSAGLTSEKQADSVDNMPLYLALSCASDAFPTQAVWSLYNVDMDAEIQIKRFRRCHASEVSSVS